MAQEYKSVPAKAVVANDGDDEEENYEWVAEPEPGVLLTLAPMPNSCNTIKKMRFSKEYFDDDGAKKWWNENIEKIMELYSIVSCQSSPLSIFGHQSVNHSFKIEEFSEISGRFNEIGESSNTWTPEATRSSPANDEIRTVDDEEEEKSDKVSEWILEDEPGVFVTVCVSPNCSKRAVKVELSQEMFGTEEARDWWETNKERVQKQYST